LKWKSLIETHPKKSGLAGGCGQIKSGPESWQQMLTEKIVAVEKGRERQRRQRKKSTEEERLHKRCCLLQLN